MNQLKQAYFVLGLPAGSPLSICLERYKQLVMIWHPDRLPKDHPMHYSAAQELKKINHACDLLKEHFKGGHHSDSGFCACRSDDRLNCDLGGDSAGARDKANSTQHQAQESTDKSHTSSESAAPNASARTASSAPPASSHPSPTQIRFRWRCIRIIAVVIFLLYALALMIQDSRASRQSAPPQQVAPGSSPDGGDRCPALNGAQLGRSPFPGDNPGLR